MYEKFNKPIQQLIQLMKEYYPCGYELVLTSNDAAVRSTEKQLSFTNETVNEEASPYFYNANEKPKTKPDIERINRILKAVYK